MRINSFLPCQIRVYAALMPDERLNRSGCGTAALSEAFPPPLAMKQASYGGRAEAFGEGGRAPPCRQAEAGRYDYRLRNSLTRSRKVCWVSGSATLVVRVARWRSSSARR